MSDDETNVAVLDILRRANPVPIDSVADRRDRPSAHALFAEITTRPPRRVRRRTVIVVVALIVLAIASVLGAFAVVDRAAEPDPSVLPFCYERADLGSERVVAAGPDLVQACAQLWEMGGGFAGPTPKSFDRCLLRGGVVAVFPGESGSVCGALGLRSVRTTSYGERLRAAQNAAGLAVLRQCRTRDPGAVIAWDDAVAVVQGILDEHDITDWTIEPGDHILRPAEPCASLAFVSETKTVLIQAINWEGWTPSVEAAGFRRPSAPRRSPRAANAASLPRRARRSCR